MPHPDLERGMDENLEPLLGNRTGHTKISDVAIRSSDTLSLSSSNNVVRQDKVSHPHLQVGKKESKKIQQATTMIGNSTSSIKVHFGKFGAEVESS